MATRTIAAATLTLALAAACGGGGAHGPLVQATPAPLFAAGPGRVEAARFHSPALGVDKHYLVYLPGGYDDAPDRRYPVVYMLHGLGGDETNWIRAGKLDRAADALRLQAIVVMPDGDASFYANSATPADRDACLATAPTFAPQEPPARYCVAHARYEDYVTVDLIGHVDATYRTIADRRGRGIGGLSMGGFGALQLAMRHPHLFASAASHSGVDALLYAGPHPYAGLDAAILVEDVASWGREVEPIGAHVRAIFGPDRETWRAHDPATLAGGLADGDLAIYLDCGTEDEFLLHAGAQYLHDLLTARGVRHEWYLGPGKHDFRFWADRIDDSLRFHARHLSPPIP